MCEGCGHFSRTGGLSAEPWGDGAMVVPLVGLSSSKKSHWTCRFRGSSFDVYLERGSVGPRRSGTPVPC